VFFTLFRRFYIAGRFAGAYLCGSINPEAAFVSPFIKFLKNEHDEKKQKFTVCTAFCCMHDRRRNPVMPDYQLSVRRIFRIYYPRIRLIGCINIYIWRFIAAVLFP
jgi:hypothetical protein